MFTCLLSKSSLFLYYTQVASCPSLFLFLSVYCLYSVPAHFRKTTTTVNSFYYNSTTTNGNLPVRAHMGKKKRNFVRELRNNIFVSNVLDNFYINYLIKYNNSIALIFSDMSRNWQKKPFHSLSEYLEHRFSATIH